MRPNTATRHPMRQKLPKLPQNAFILPIGNILTATLLYRVPNLAFRLIKGSIEIRLLVLTVHIIIRRDYEHLIVATQTTLRWWDRYCDTALRGRRSLSSYDLIIQEGEFAGLLFGGSILIHRVGV